MQQYVKVPQRSLKVAIQMLREAEKHAEMLLKTLPPREGVQLNIGPRGFKVTRQVLELYKDSVIPTE